jgi:hypothetical protein
VAHDTAAPDSLGLRPRPAVDPVVAALLAEAVLDVWPRPPAADAAAEAARIAREREAGLNWRLSGRWWTRPAPVGRNRPWVR